MMPHPQFSLPALQPQDPKPKTSKGVRAYPDKWRQVLNRAKDIVRFSVLLQEPFPRPAQACITVTECFHEAMTIECGNNMVLEPGMLCFKTIVPSNVSHPVGKDFHGMAK